MTNNVIFRVSEWFYRFILRKENQLNTMGNCYKLENDILPKMFCSQSFWSVVRGPADGKTFTVYYSEQHFGRCRPNKNLKNIYIYIYVFTRSFL